MAKAVKELRDAIENMPEGNDSEKRRKKEYEFFLFDVIHESRTILFDRIQGLLNSFDGVGQDKLSYAASFLPVNGGPPVSTESEMNENLQKDAVGWFNFVRTHIKEETYLELANFVLFNSEYVSQLRSKYPTISPIPTPRLQVPVFGSYTRPYDDRCKYTGHCKLFSNYLGFNGGGYFPIGEWWLHYFPKPFDETSYKQIQLVLPGCNCR